MNHHINRIGLYGIRILCFIQFLQILTLYKTYGSPVVPLGQAICDTSPAFVAGQNTPRTFSSEQPNFKPSFKFQVAVDVVVVVVDATVVVVVVGVVVDATVVVVVVGVAVVCGVVVDATVVVVVVGVAVVFGLRSRK